MAQFTAVASARSLLRGAKKLIMLAALASSVPAGAAAQSAFGSVSSGDRIRISTAMPDSSTGTGRVVSVSEDTLVVRTNQNGREITRAFPRSQITRLDVSMGASRGRKSQYAGFGLLVGLGIAQLLPHEEGSLDGAADFVADALLLSGLGAGIGAYLGRSHEGWRRVRLGASRVSLNLPRSGQGVGLRASMAF
ncbi:MAG: hypothetical protein DMD35_08210 [Gemmatimonadetes bacterium]|nr:MAG: hypothetical protein DMD35_08210 [Gemmatimonadota bacterium]